jgi:hypothetical protein
MIQRGGKSISLEEAMQNYLLEAEEQAREVDEILELSDDALKNTFIIRAIRATLVRNKELLNKIADTGKAIEHWKKHPERYAKIRKRIEEDEALIDELDK